MFVLKNLGRSGQNGARVLKKASRSIGSTSKNFQNPESKEEYYEEPTKTLRPPACQMPNLMDIGSRSIFNEDHDMFRESARKFFREVLHPQHKKFEADGKVSRDIWRELGKMGFLGISLPAEKGGVGGTFLDEAIVLEEQAYAHCHAPAITVHSTIVMPYITNYGTPEQIEKYMPLLSSGEMVGAIAMTEPDAGSDLQGIRTKAKRDGENGDFILNGSKVFITNGILSNLVIVVAITDPTAKSNAHGITLFLVEDGTPGFKKGKNLNKVGMKAHDTAELFFEDVRLPESAILGGLNKGFYQLMTELPQERLALAVNATASCEYMFEATREYVMQRKAFGGTLSSLQTIQHKMAELKTSIAVCRSFIDECIAQHNIGQLGNDTASMAKYWSTDLESKVATECLQLHGGWGYMMDTCIARSFIDARVQSIYGGSNEIMKELIARTIVKPVK